MNSFTFKTLSILGLLLCLPSCNRELEINTAPDDGKQEEPTNRIDISPTVRSNIGITFAKVERRKVANTLRVPGSFELQALAKREYRMMLSGHVEFLVAQFDKVKAGTPLYRFRSLELLDLQRQVDLARAALGKAEATYNAAQSRQRALAKADFKKAELSSQITELEADITQREVQLLAATAAFDSASQVTDTDAENNADQIVKNGWVEVRSEQAGVVNRLSVTNGTFVDAASLILTTVDPEKLRFKAMALQSDLSQFENGQEVQIVPPQGAGNDLNASIPAKLQIGLDADPQQRTIPLFATPTESQPWSRPGVSAFLEIAKNSTDGVALAIPRSAVVKDGITHVFFKRDPLDPNKAIRIVADLGVDDGRWIAIKSELGPNDEVVVDGAYELKLASAQSGTSQEGGHFHADGSYHGEAD